MYALIPALVLLALFGIGVLRDRRRFSNAVLLGLATLFLGAAALGHLAGDHSTASELIGLAVLLVLLLGTLILPVFLITNGVKMVRKEGRRPANLLSLLAGLTIVALAALLGTALNTHSRALTTLTGTALLVFAYVSFLFACFIGYAFLYGRMKVRGDVDYVVVLGSGLIDGERVPPLLASRLEKARKVYETQAARPGAAPPTLLTSGGQGPDEKLPESHAMADHLTQRGVPPEHVLREDRSRTTEENLALSGAMMAAADPGYRCVIVTNNFHAFRAALTARAQGVNGQVIGSPTAAYFWPSATIREFAAVFLTHKAVNLTICGALAVLGALLWWNR